MEYTIAVAVLVILNNSNEFNGAHGIPISSKGIEFYTSDWNPTPAKCYCDNLGFIHVYEVRYKE